MPKLTQIIPEHKYPHNLVVINDNTQYIDQPSTSSGDTKMLFVFASPKGKDGTIQTIKDGLGGFLKEYGQGPHSLYGQPYLNAYAAAASRAATLHCLRVTAVDASYSCVNVVAKYKVIMDDDVATGFSIKFEAKPSSAPLTDLSNLSTCYTAAASPDGDGFTEVKLFSAAYIGKGIFGQNVILRIVSNNTNDKINSFKNYYLELYVNEGALIKTEEFPVIFKDDAIVSGISMGAESVVNDIDDGSKIIQLEVFEAGFKAIYDAYVAAFPSETATLTFDTFDALFGKKKNDTTVNAAYTDYTIDTASLSTINIAALTGIPLQGGSDGGFGINIAAETRETNMTAQYLAAYNGTIDPDIQSKNKFPTNIILDANFAINVKKQIAALGTLRTDCAVALDCGTGISKSTLLTYVSENLDNYVENRVHCIEGYYGKIKDPYNNKIITVTGTYGLASAYPIHFQNHGAKHVPLAGNSFGVLSGYIKNSIYPIFDEDIDGDLMDALCDARVNFARINAIQEIIRATQTTRQDINSALSELSNVFILLDIKRDCEKLSSSMDFNFSEPSDLALYNKLAQNLLTTYADSQVRSIEASYGKNSFESERGYLHLYVGFVHKDIVKTSIIEIDVNR